MRVSAPIARRYAIRLSIGSGDEEVASRTVRTRAQLGLLYWLAPAGAISVRLSYEEPAAVQPVTAFSISRRPFMSLLRLGILAVLGVAAVSIAEMSVDAARLQGTSDRAGDQAPRF